MRVIIKAALLVGVAAALGACGAQPAAAPAQPTAAAAAAPAAPAAGGVAQWSVSDLKQQIEQDKDLFVLDVRTPEEYTGDKHIAGSHLIPLDQLEQRLAEVPTDRQVACVCRSGNRSGQACALLAAKGYTKLANMQGGMKAWLDAGYAATN